MAIASVPVACDFLPMATELPPKACASGPIAISFILAASEYAPIAVAFVSVAVAKCPMAKESPDWLRVILLVHFYQWQYYLFRSNWHLHP